jgi:hypothetical protein
MCCVFGGSDLAPVDAFWSLTLYDNATCQLVENPIARYSIGDRTPGLVRDAQGGLRIQVGHRWPTHELAASATGRTLSFPAGLSAAPRMAGRALQAPVRQAHGIRQGLMRR